MMVRLRALRERLFVAQAENRGRERLRRAGLSGVTSTVSQALVIATGLISVPLTVKYLGQERYGVWLTLNSLLNWLAISNLGFAGNALINSLSEANGRDDRELARELVATAFWSLVGIALVLTLLFVVTFQFISWPAVFNAPSTVSLSELHWAVIFSLTSFVLIFPLSIVDAIYQSYQKGYIGNIWTMAGSALSLVALIAVTRVRGGLPLLVVALSGVRILVTLGNVGYLFGRQYPWLLPSPHVVSRRSLRLLSSLGVKYVVAQLAGIGMFQSQPMIIAHALGPAQVGIFNVTQRLLTLPLMVVQMFIFPLMPAYGEAQARQDWTWIRRTLWRTLAGTAIASVLMIVPLIFFARPVIRLWIGPEMAPGQTLIWLMSFYVLVAGVVTPASVMLYGLKRVGAQAVFATANALATVFLGIWLTASWGLSGMAAAMLIALTAINPIAQATQIHVAFRDKRVHSRHVSHPTINTEPSQSTQSS